MSATYTWDIFSTLDGYGSYGPDGDWGGYWGKHGPEFLAHRLSLFSTDQRIVFGAKTYQSFAQMPEDAGDSDLPDASIHKMLSLPAIVVSSTLTAPLYRPNMTIAKGNAGDIVTRLKQESDVPLRSTGSLSINRALMAAGLVDFVQVTIFPVISGKTGTRPIFEGAADFDLELVESRTLDSNIQELIYRPTLHG
jgi:dihydrofolate reductase